MKVTVHIPDERAAALDRVADRAFGGNRSAAVDSAIEPLLRDHGELPGSPEHRLREKLDAALAALGSEEMEKVVDEILAAAAERAAKEPVSA